MSNMKIFLSEPKIRVKKLLYFAAKLRFALLFFVSRYCFPKIQNSIFFDAKLRFTLLFSLRLAILSEIKESIFLVIFNEGVYYLWCFSFSLSEAITVVECALSGIILLTLGIFGKLTSPKSAFDLHFLLKWFILSSLKNKKETWKRILSLHIFSRFVSRFSTKTRKLTKQFILFTAFKTAPIDARILPELLNRITRRINFTLFVFGRHFHIASEFLHPIKSLNEFCFTKFVAVMNEPLSNFYGFCS